MGKTTVPAIIGIMPDGDNIMVFGGKQLKAAGKYLFPDNVRTNVFVTQSGPDHVPCVGFEFSVEHGELHGPSSMRAHFEGQVEFKHTRSYKLSFLRPIKGANVVAFKLADSTADDEELDTLPSKFVVPSITDANKKGTVLFETLSLTLKMLT